MRVLWESVRGGRIACECYGRVLGGRFACECYPFDARSASPLTLAALDGKVLEERFARECKGRVRVLGEC